MFAIIERMILPMKNETIYGKDDGLLIPDVGPWTEDKFDLIRLYCQIFSSAMKRKWTRVYIDLYAGSGLCRIKGSKQILLGSPLIALSVDTPFDQYIFCESDPERFNALKSRVKSGFPNANTTPIQGRFEEHLGNL
jgi:three-Cys-motif partner protein